MPGTTLANEKPTNETPTDETPHPLRTVWPPLELEEHPIDDRPPIRVVVVGAGISGIVAGILLPAKVPNIELIIYERNSDIVRVDDNSSLPVLLIFYREAFGIQTSTQVSGVMSLLMPTRQHLRPPPPGPKLTHKVLKLKPTGKES